MKKTIAFIAAAVFALSSCGDFDDMSKNPYALYDAPAESFVHPIVFNTQYNLISVFRSTTVLLMQYAVSTNSEVSSRVIDNYNIPEGTTDDVWSSLYICWGNAMAMYDKAEETGDEAMKGVALILKAFLITQISDTYGDVPFKDAGLLPINKDSTVYTTRYDTQKDIYKAVIIMLEEANEILANYSGQSFNAVCDKVYAGDFDKWRRFGNTLYARVLMRIAMKVIEEDGGVLELGDDKWEAISVKNKLGELYNSFQSGSGDYPQMRSRGDRFMVPFSETNETEHTPFYTITSGNWNTVAVSDVLCRRMLGTEQKVDSKGITYYKYVPSSSGGHIEDPRYDCWWRKANGMPVHLLNKDRVEFLDNAEHKSQAGNSSIGRMVRKKNPSSGALEPSAITGKVYDLQNAEFYSMFNYSELPFIYAEAGARGWISSISSFGAYLDLLKQGITESILEWNPYVTASSDEVIAYVNHCVSVEKYSGSILNSDNALEAILTQKWLAEFFIGIESWCDYRRTGYPLLKTNGPAASNDQILPTRMRYPSDEQYRNAVYYPEVLDRWLGGSDNNTTDVWWASTAESVKTRLKGRQ
ncbi:MAG: SusD/RagB family nutrient-binding outer membrane lipoprotein [Bacteroidales bacterium]|nr:SusD/RagB family nutrient-binding outer membrane lipoprotein [Bacteroidales bacterium]